MSQATATIYCTISPPLSGAMEDCSIVGVQQLHCKCSITEDAVCPRHNTCSAGSETDVTQKHWRWSPSSLRVPWWQSHRRSGLATPPSVGAVP